MGSEALSDLISSTLLLVIKVAGPMLLAGLVVGLVMGVIQAATQVNEMTLTFTSKLIAVGLAFLATLPWSINQMMAYTRDIMAMVAAGPGH